MRTRVLVLLLLLLPSVARSQSTSTTGRISSGTLATRPACPTPAVSGDSYIATDQNPVVAYICDSANGWSFLSNVPTLPNQNLAFSATPVFASSVNINYTMTLTGNVTSSTTTGTPRNGTLLGLTLIQDAPGNRTFAFPANFVLPVGYSFDITSLHTNALVFRYDGTNWQLFMNAGGGGSGGSPGGVNGDVQIKSGAGFAAGGENDNGTTITQSRDIIAGGPNPYFDIRKFGAAVFAQTTTCTINSASTAMTIASNWNGANGTGIVCRGAGPNTTLTTPVAGPAVTAANASGPTGTGQMISNTSGATTYQYQFIPIGLGADYPIASPVVSIANGMASLGMQQVSITSFTKTNNSATINTATNHNLVPGAMVQITGLNGVGDGYWLVGTTPTASSFTIVTSNDTRIGAPAVGGGGLVTWWQGNKIVIPHQAGAWKYAVYGRTAGSMVFLGYTFPDNNTIFTSDPTYNVFEDYGTPFSNPPTRPDWLPNTPPVAAKNTDLVTTVVSGAGTTSLVVANAASNTVAGAVAKHDNAPNILAAAAAANNTGVLYIPATTIGSAFQTNSILYLPSASNSLSVMQVGSLSLGDTMVMPRTVTWAGQPVESLIGGGSFSWQTMTSITNLGAATPMIFSTGPAITSYVNITSNVGNGVIWFQDSTNDIPNSRFDHVGFWGASGGTEFSSQGLVIRNNIGGGAFWTFDYINFGNFGPGGGVLDSTPVFHNTQGMGPVTMKHIFTAQRPMYFGMATTGLQMTIEGGYCQGCNGPHYVLQNNTGAFVGPYFDLHMDIEDTTSQPVVSYMGNYSGGSISLIGTTALPGRVINGPAGVATASIANREAIMGSESGVIGGTGIDGILSQNSGLIYVKQFNASLSLGPTFKSFVNSTRQPAPSAVLGVGGTVAVGVQGPFIVAPVFSDGSEGSQSFPSPQVTTTPGNQTIIITWTPVPNAIGYDVYRNGFSFQCTPPWIVGGNVTTFTWSGQVACGVGLGQVGGGPSYMGPSSMGAGQFLYSGGGFVDTVSGSFPTVNRTQTLPDASGTFLLDSTLIATVPLQSYDNFTRANGLVNAGTPPVPWQIFSAPTISGNTVIGGNNSQNNRAWCPTCAKTANQYSEITLGSNGGAVQATVRDTGVFNLSLYACQISNTGSTILKIISFAVTGLIGDAVVRAPGDRTRCEAIGTAPTTLNMYVNGVLTLTTTDSSLPSGSPGFNIVSNTAANLNNWSGGDIVTTYPTLNLEQSWKAPQHFTTISVGNFPPSGTPSSGLYLGSSIPLVSTSGNSGRVGETLGTLTSGNLGSWDVNGNGVDSGIAVSSVLTGSRKLITSAYTNATTTASNITGLSFAVAATTNYSATCQLYYQGSVATAGLDITITGPAAPTSIFYSYDEYPTITTVQSSVANAFATKLTGNAAVTATTNLHASVTIGLVNGANAGTVQVQGSATGVGTVTIQPGSFCTVQ